MNVDIYPSEDFNDDMYVEEEDEEEDYGPPVWVDEEEDEDEEVEVEIYLLIGNNKKMEIAKAIEAVKLDEDVFLL